MTATTNIGVEERVPEAANKAKAVAAPSADLEKQRIELVNAPQFGPNDALAWRAFGVSAALWLAVVFTAPNAFSFSLPAVMWAILAGGTSTRIFMMFHDAAHNSFFTSAEANRVLGENLAILIWTPYAIWKYGHNRHHQVQGNLDLLDEAATIAHTTKEFAALPLWQRVLYRVFRDPLIFFPLLPFVVWNVVLVFDRRASWQSLGATFIQGAVYYGAFWLRGLPATYLHCCLLVLSIQWFSGLVGVLLFHLQHSVNTGYRADTKSFSAHDAAVLGSTFTYVPWWYKWATLGIEYHHIHHLSTRVPSYNLRACHEAGEARGLWKEVTTVTPTKALASVSNVLWDEASHTYVSFWPYHHIARAFGEPDAGYMTLFNGASTAPTQA